MHPAHLGKDKEILRPDYLIGLPFIPNWSL